MTTTFAGLLLDIGGPVMRLPFEEDTVVFRTQRPCPLVAAEILRPPAGESRC